MDNFDFKNECEQGIDQSVKELSQKFKEFKDIANKISALKGFDFQQKKEKLLSALEENKFKEFIIDCIYNFKLKDTDKYLHLTDDIRFYIIRKFKYDNEVANFVFDEYQRKFGLENLKCEHNSREEKPDFFKFHVERFIINAEKIKNKFDKNSEIYKHEVNGEIKEILSTQLYQEMAWELFSLYEKTKKPEYIKIYKSLCDALINLHEDKRSIDSTFELYLERIPAKSISGNLLLLSISLNEELEGLSKKKKLDKDKLIQISMKLEAVNKQIKKAIRK